MHPADSEDLIARLSGGLDPHDRAAFRRAAENALATEPACSGEGASYRVISKLWRGYFRPARETGDFGWSAKRGQPDSKLIREGQRRGRNRTPPRRDFAVVRIGRGSRGD